MPTLYDSHTLGTGVLRCNSIAEIRALSPLPPDAERVIDQAVVDVGLERLVIIADLMAAGMTFKLDDPLSVTFLEWESQSKTGGAQRTMHPGARGENQLPDRTQYRIPIYATTEHFQLGIRTLRASQRVGAPLDVNIVKQSARRINEALEDAAWNGATTRAGTAFKVDGYDAPGILTHSSINTYAYTGGEAWDVVGHTGEEILTDTLEMVEKLQNDHFYGPYNLYVPTSYGLKLMEDFKSNSSLTIQQRLQELVAGGRGINVKVADQLPANKTVLMQMTDDVMDVIVGQETIPLTWESANGMERFWMLLAFIIPRVKADYDGNCGICVGFTS